MKLMVVGGGGREHTIIKKLKENPAVTELYALPGNGGIAADATCVPASPSARRRSTGSLPLQRSMPSTMPSSRRTIRWCWAAWTRWRRSA